MSRLPCHLQLTGGDYFIHAIDRRMRRTGMAGNICRIVIRLEGGPDAERFRQRVAASPVFDWLGCIRMKRRFPGFPPAWRTSSQRTGIFHEHTANGTAGDIPDSLPPALLERELRADRNPAIALDFVRHADGSAHLVFSWNHALLDVRGVEMLLRLLHTDNKTGNPPAAEDLVNPDQTRFNLLRRWLSLPRRMMTARGSLALINKTCPEPLFSLQPSLRPAAACQHHYRIVNFSENETAQIDEHGQRLNAGFRRSLFYLAATIQAVHAIAQRRGGASGAYLVPMPHDLRRRDANRPIFSNQISFLFYRIEPALADRLPETIAELARQMMDQAHDRTPESFAAAMEMFKPMPLDFYVYRLGRPTRGKFASFFFSDAGETCAGMDVLLGGRITAVTHLAPTSRPPGLTVVFSRFRKQLSAVLAYVEDCLSAEEVNGLEGGLRAALAGEATA